MCVPSVQELDVTTFSPVANAWTTINIENMLSQYINSLIQGGMTRYTVPAVALHLTLSIVRYTNVKYVWQLNYQIHFVNFAIQRACTHIITNSDRKQWKNSWLDKYYDNQMWSMDNGVWTCINEPDIVFPLITVGCNCFTI